MNLDPDNAATKAHIGLVTKQLSKQLQEYIGKNPHEKITRSMKMLLMATESLRKNTDWTDIANEKSHTKYMINAIFIESKIR